MMIKGRKQIKVIFFLPVHIMPLVTVPVSSCSAVLVGISTHGELGKKKPLTFSWIPVSFRWMALVLISKSSSWFHSTWKVAWRQMKSTTIPPTYNVLTVTRTKLYILILFSYSWRAIMDNLMTHDKTTFRDLMSEYCGMTI